MAALHREVPLSLPSVSRPALESLRRLVHPPVAQSWRTLRLTSEQTFLPSTGLAIRSNVKTVWTHAPQGVLRRSDDWYDVGGSKPLYQERTLTWLGLVGLRWVERQPAPIYHDIFEDEGWFGESTIAMSVVAIDKDFPLRAGTRFEASTIRRTDVPTIAKQVRKSKDYERRIVCKASASVTSAQLHATLSGVAVPVTCESSIREAGDSEYSASGNVHLLYSVELGVYLPIERREKEPRSPFDADDAPPRWASTTIAYRELAVEP